MRYKKLFSKLDAALAEIDSGGGLTSRLQHFLNRIVKEFREDLGLVSGRLYVNKGDHYAILHESPEQNTSPLLGVKVDANYAPIQRVKKRGFVLYDADDPAVDKGVEEPLGVETFAAITVGQEAEHIMAFSLSPEAKRDDILYALQTIRRVVDQQLRHERLHDRVAEVREIQGSLLPNACPEFHDFDIFGRSDPAEEVGGDLFDFMEISPTEIGVAIIDSAGHGLPAALQARDAVIGLRMGVQRDMRITKTIEKLNDVIHRSALASKFVALVYGELEANGTFVYTNAGHLPPILQHEGGFRRLEVGGRVLGPLPDAKYRRGYARIEPGDRLLFFTDGIVEVENEGGEDFGENRLITMLAEHSGSAEELVNKIFSEVQSFSNLKTPTDDQTVVAIFRKPESA